jgi:iron complex transport system substrate-binding protein
MKKRTALTLCVTLALVMAGCGDTKDPAPEAASTADTPQRIVSLSPTATEMLYAIGAGDKVVAVDDQSNFPANAPRTALSGFDPNVEAISGYEPDLVVIAGDTKDLKAQLKAISIPVLDLPAAATLEDTYEQVTVLGERTGHESKARSVAANLRKRIAELRKDVPKRDVPLTYYHELDTTLFSVTSETFIGEIYALAGLENVADAADPEGANGGYPQITSEFLVTADPDLVFLADTKCCQQTAATFAARPGFSVLKAVEQNHVVSLDDDVASRWGPRVVDLFAQIVSALKSIPQT